MWKNEHKVDRIHVSVKRKICGNKAKRFLM